MEIVLVSYGDTITAFNPSTIVWATTQNREVNLLNWPVIQHHWWLALEFY